ncbi:NAD(P)/FAD-dependent oxidoreductase [Myxococcota bacterium]|nr:NAD(P)/FAD-dependent oxidoreductase [Myxococcota bacterium]MCZ7620226.1 NAD(P)/FAD-dependent oxidoreductase [Myxococcota bacterium]
MQAQPLDVAIVGGGLAGSLLARQLSRAHPGLRIAVFEKKSAYTHNIGESIVELGSHYLIRRLGLSSELYDRHFPKNGLRFFFDTAEHDAALPAMSEIGSASLPFHPAFQIDRSRLERDLLEQSGRDGVEVHHGVRVEKIEVGQGGLPHHLVASDAEGTRSFTSRWLVDASGRGRLLARQLDLHVDETVLDNAAIWGWFRGVADIDQMGPDSFRSRVHYTTRRLSTLHFVYRGYWIWFIPLQEGVTSIGVVCEQPHYDPRHASQDGFLAWLRQHRAVASLLESATPIATQSSGHLAYGTRRFLSPDRWGLVGEASAFPDPFYSPGTDFIALENDFLADLIARDLAGEPTAALAERTELYEQFLQFRFEAALQLYRGLYPVLGSYEVCKLKWDLDVGCYYALWLAPYLFDRHLDLGYLKRQLAQRKRVLGALANFAALFVQVEKHLSERGAYHRRNLGEYSEGRDGIGFLEQLGRHYSERETMQRVQKIFNTVRRQALDLLEDGAPATPREDRPLAWFATAASLVDG